MRTRSSLLLTLALLLLAATGLIACGDDSSSSSDDVDKVLSDTFSPGQKVESGKLDLALDLDLQGVPSLSAPVKVALAGPFQSAGDKGGLPNFDFTAKLAFGGQDFSVGAVSTGEKGFVRFQGKTYEVGDELFAAFKKGYEQAQKQSGSKGKGTSLQSLGIDPRRWLKNAEKEGEESVGGAETIHVSAEIDVPKFLDDVNTLLGRAGSLGVAGSTPRKVPSKLTAEQRAPDRGRGEVRRARHLHGQGRPPPAPPRHRRRTRRARGRAQGRRRPVERQRLLRADARRPQRGPDDRGAQGRPAALGAHAAVPGAARPVLERIGVIVGRPSVERLGLLRVRLLRQRLRRRPRPPRARTSSASRRPARTSPRCRSAPGCSAAARPSSARSPTGRARPPGRARRHPAARRPRRPPTPAAARRC